MLMMAMLLLYERHADAPGRHVMWSTCFLDFLNQSLRELKLSPVKVDLKQRCNV